ncbi:MAG: hypothetical protein WAO55_13730 [Candidatus Manganitrophaceae bacterium]
MEEYKTMEKIVKIIKSVLLSGYIFFAYGSPVQAAVVPVPGQLGYRMYEIGVLGILQGPIGFVVAVGGVAASAVALYQASVWVTIFCILATGMLISAVGIATSLGAII